ncbi:antibiotic biosynthesis monooxygenase [Mesorhizobium sp. B2-4-12]|uniref:putative quinol monooxygenase n=1 Tax=unclassified Mesorhizobium TaxID=325217 RepID=UPI00112B5A65|nr:MULTISPECIES: putative quinol monooxygenase [unclassified Mesorhizobium]TPK96898.1 antibiotic biosynthesis monooxygenase [Mesorhizobium sp. B2-4-12]UCI34934.1 antibiotic biosynthesis monooxygenase [Mesorhizobium sp. B4-1-4]
MSTVTNLAFFRARPGRTNELGIALMALVEPTRSESECLTYNLHQSVEDPDVWFVYENWKTASGLDAHMHAKHVREFLAAAPTLITGDVELRRFSMISAFPTRAWDA